MQESDGAWPAVTGSPCPPVVPALFVVGYADEEYEFADGDRRRFGRDDDACEIPIWEEVRGTNLSKVAGVLWCMDGELWVRNVSAAHELCVGAPGSAPDFLPVCPPGEPGAARSVPVPVATISAPSTGRWAMSIRSLVHTSTVRGTPGTGTPSDDGEQTTRIARAPDRLLPVAVALCAPLFVHDRHPATYDQVVAELGVTRRQARRRVDDLCAHYRTRYPGLLSGDPRSTEPVYAELARLLVRRGAVTGVDVSRLRGTG
jgi:hypothetical protein